MYDCEGIGKGIAYRLGIPNEKPYLILTKEEISHNSLNYEELEILFRLNLWRQESDRLWYETYERPFNL